MKIIVHKEGERSFYVLSFSVFSTIVVYPTHTDRYSLFAIRENHTTCPTPKVNIYIYAPPSLSPFLPLTMSVYLFQNIPVDTTLHTRQQ